MNLEAAVETELHSHREVTAERITALIKAQFNVEHPGEAFPTTFNLKSWLNNHRKRKKSVRALEVEEKLGVGKAKARQIELVVARNGLTGCFGRADGSRAVT